MASSPRRRASRDRSTTSWHFGQLKCTADGTVISSPFTGSRRLPRFSTIVVPHAGQASSGSARPRRRRIEPFWLGTFFVISVLVLVERHDYAAVPKDQFQVDQHAADLRLEQVHPLACRVGHKSFDEVRYLQALDGLAGVRRVQPNRGQLAESLQREADLLLGREGTDAPQDLGESGRHAGRTPYLFGELCIW